MEKLLLGIRAGTREIATCSFGGAQEIQFRALVAGLPGMRCGRESNHPALLTLSKGEAIFGQRIRTVYLMPFQPQTLFRISAQVMSMVTGRRTGVACYIYHPRQ
jgi:hypothetical protein